MSGRPPSGVPAFFCPVYGKLSGITTVLPYYDIPTHSYFPTLTLYDSTLTTTPRTAEFFNTILAQLGRELGIA